MRSYNTKEIDLERVGGGIEFIPTHYVRTNKMGGIRTYVMELGKSATGLTMILYEDGARGKVFASDLVPLPFGE
jgi:hypothetical protein